MLHLLLTAGVLRPPPRAPPRAAVRLSAEPINTATPTPRAEGSVAAEPISAANSTAATGVLAGLAGSTAAAVTTAGGVCVGGACAPVAVGAAAGTTAGAAGAAGAALGGLKLWLAGGALLAASVGTQLLGAPQLGPALEGMVRASTPIAEASASGRPTVFEFYRPDCPRCRALAQSGLRAVEEEARAKGVNWVMLDTNSPAVYRAYVRKYGVADLPHFTFFAADGHVMGAESGLTADVDGLAARVAGLARSSALFPSG